MRFLPRRSLGRTGFGATRLGAGDLADRQLPLEVCVDTLRRALDAGLNVVDTAPAYEDGYSEAIVGRALRGRRHEVFLIDKIDHLDRPVRPQVEKSLRTLGLEHVDAFVFHGVSTDQAWACVLERRLGELDDCVRAGKLLGDTEGYGRPLGDRPSSAPPTRPTLTVDECVSYTLTADPDVALLGLSSPAEQDAAFAAAEQFAPLDAHAMAAIRGRAALAIEGKCAVWWNPSD